MNKEEIIVELERLKFVLSGEVGKELLKSNKNMFYGIWINLFLKYTQKRKTISTDELKMFFDVHPDFEKNFRGTYDCNLRKVLEHEFYRKCEQFQKTVYYCHNTMLMIINEKGECIPSEIKLPEYYELEKLLNIKIFTMPVNAEFAYTIFKWYLFTRMAKGNSISIDAWQKVKESSPEMLERLIAEGRHYYDKLGYYEAFEKMQKLKDELQQKLEEISYEEQIKVKEIHINGRRIKVI